MRYANNKEVCYKVLDGDLAADRGETMKHTKENAMFFCPTRIIFTEGAMQVAEPHLKAMGSKALIVCGKHSAVQSGALDDLTNCLERLEISYTVFAQISENPVLADVIRGSSLMREESCNFVIGVGGGSPIDAAKAISLAAANHLAEHELYSLDKFRTAYPIVAIPTTAGTGTEATQYSVLTDPLTKKKAGFGHPFAFPKLAILDAKYTLSLPPYITLNTALDALSHLLEGLYSNQRSPMLYPLIHRGIGIIVQQLPTVLQDGSKLEVRKQLMQASLYGGMVIAQGSTTLQHSIGYPLTSEYDIPHGLANAMVMEEIMKLYQTYVEQELQDLFTALGISREQFFAWLDALPFRKGVAVSDEFIERVIPQIMASRNMALNPLKVGEDDVRRILQKLKEKA